MSPDLVTWTELPVAIPHLPDELVFSGSVVCDRKNTAGFAGDGILAGVYGASGVLAALHDRERTGRGQIVRASLLAATVGRTPFREPDGRVLARFPRPRGTTTFRSRPTGSSPVRTVRSRSRSAANASGATSAPASISTPMQTDSAPIRSESQPAARERVDQPRLRRMEG